MKNILFALLVSTLFGSISNADQVGNCIVQAETYVCGGNYQETITCHSNRFKITQLQEVGNSRWLTYLPIYACPGSETECYDKMYDFIAKGICRKAY